MSSPSSADTRTDALFASATDAALDTVRRNITAFGSLYPADTTARGRYPLRPAHDAFAEGGNYGWTTSFWPGMQWLAFERSGDDAFRDAALAHARDFERRLRGGEDLDTHDIGFLYTLAAVAPWRLLGDESARETAIAAADQLMTRFLEPAGIIQAWGDLADPHQRGRTIIDSLMNMPLLMWAYEQTGQERFVDAVRRHTEQLRVHIMRGDDSTFHTFYWDPVTGEPLRGATEQGAHDDSCWARGQAWGIYGFAMAYRFTGDERMLVAAHRCARYFLAHLPADAVPYWDLVYTDDSDAPRDSSAGAIAAAGLFELARVDTDAGRAEHADADARRLLAALVVDCAPAPRTADTLLLHGVYDLPKGNGVDEGNLWGDYFYLEALTRAVNPDWNPYW